MFSLTKKQIAAINRMAKDNPAAAVRMEARFIQARADQFGRDEMLAMTGFRSHLHMAMVGA